jgi:signal transduction histidine kinase
VFRTLYGKLALALLALLGIVAVLHFAVSGYTTEMYLQEVRQKLNRELAPHLVEEGVLLPDGNVDPDALEHILHMLMVVNPNIEVYVLDPEGRVLAYSTPPGKVHRERVSLEPVGRFLAEDARFPILGDDPRDPERRKVFSVAPIGDAGAPDGYVYVILGGELYDSVVRRLQGSYVLRRGATALATGLVFAFAAGLLLFALMTRRLRRLASAMETFERSGFTAADPGLRPTTGRRDEIDRLGETFSRMSDRMRKQLTDLEQADRLRRELVANVSHDLRTPLASLQGYLDTLLLKDGQLDPEQRRHYLEIAARHGGRLGKRVAELFELAKLDACDTPLEREPFSLAELVQDVVQKFQLQADQARIQLYVEREMGLPLVSGDVGLIERVLENLLGNAIRHTPEGGQVTVSTQGGRAGLRVEVRDTGPGIPSEEIPLIFDRFYRSGAGHHEGAGLGLAIAKRIVELHAGTLDVRSRVGEGTVMAFNLPHTTA